MLGWNAGSPPLLSGIQGAVPSTSADFVVEALISGVEAAVSFSIMWLLPAKRRENAPARIKFCETCVLLQSRG